MRIRASYENLAEWSQRIACAVPAQWRRRVLSAHAYRVGAVRRNGSVETYSEGQQAANRWLLDVVESMRGLRVPVDLSDQELRELAEKRAADAFALAGAVPGGMPAAFLRARMAAMVERYGIKPPSEKVADGPAIARMSSPAWWRRGLRTSQARELERAAISLEYVHREDQIYASDATVERRREQRRRNAAGLEATTAENLDTGDTYNLAELAALSVANPAIRRGELMTRISGFEHVARGLGHVAEFVTLTCPSRFHPMRERAGVVEPNPKHDGANPRDAQKYLVATWAKMRAAFARRGLRLYGFRIAEPHHDATPHWHMLLFMPAMLPDGLRSLPARFRAVFRRYALAVDGDEKGAREHRAKFERIDWNRGTAAGYVLKYVAKNIEGNGYQVQGDLEGRGDAIYPAARVEAWASTWGIRQFQQIGGPPVGVWRELRRMREPVADAPASLERARVAADLGDWAGFVRTMGGPVVARSALPYRVAYTAPGERIYTSTGEVDAGRLNAYGEPAAPVAYGLRWEELVERVIGIARFSEVVERTASGVRYRWQFKAGGEAARTRTRVNNCTRGGDDESGSEGKGGFGRRGAGDENGRSCDRSAGAASENFGRPGKTGHGDGAFVGA